MAELIKDDELNEATGCDVLLALTKKEAQQLFTLLYCHVDAEADIVKGACELLRHSGVIHPYGTDEFENNCIILKKNKTRYGKI